MKVIRLLSLLLLPLLLSHCEKTAEKIASKGDLTFAKSTFESLARGDSVAMENIDWPTLQSLGQNVGASYVQIPSETGKINFQKAFVAQFSASFREVGGSPDQFENWRVSYHDDLKTEVAADSAGGTVTITVTERDGRERISGLGFIR
jgi:hypothetical protein